MAKKDEIKLPFGIRDGILVHIRSLDVQERGLKCNCTCPHCGMRLVARIGLKKQAHFAHHHEDCGGGLETALHIFAKDALLRERRLTLPAVTVTFFDRTEELAPSKTIAFDTVVLEEPFADFIPDVVMTKGASQLIIEIAVTHKVDRAKWSKIRKTRTSALEIRLKPSDMHSFLDDPQRLTAYILDDPSNKHWVYNSKASTRRKEMMIEERGRLKAEREAREARRKQRAAEEAKRAEDLERQRMRVEEKEARIQLYLSPKYQEEKRALWAAGVQQNESWKKIIQRLKIKPDVFPEFLNKEIEGDIVFACDRRIWQGQLFVSLVFNRFQGKRSRLFKVQAVMDWIKKESYLPLHGELVYLRDSHAFHHLPSLAEVLAGFCDYLAEMGFVRRAESSRQGAPYYWWYEVIHDKLEPPGTTVRSQHRMVGMTKVDLETGEIIEQDA